MEKHTIISIAAVSILVVTIGFSILNIFATENLQFKGTNENFTYFGLNENTALKVCNTLPFFASSDKLDILIFFDKEIQGIYSFDEFTLFPISSSLINGSFTSESYAESTYLFLHFDGMFTGTTPMRMDPSKMNVVVEIQTPIIGIIPFSVSKQYTSLEFWNMMNGENSVFQC